MSPAWNVFVITNFNHIHRILGKLEMKVLWSVWFLKPQQAWKLNDTPIILTIINQQYQLSQTLAIPSMPLLEYQTG